MSFEELLRTVLFLPKAASGMARSIDRLHFFVITVTMLGCALVLSVAVVFLVRYRRRGVPSATPRVHASRFSEFAFIGLLLTLFVSWWVIGFRQYVRAATPPQDALEIYVTGKQWMWKFAYPDGRATAGLVVVPVDRDTRLISTSRDVIHSFYIPAFRLKQDALPGRYTTSWIHPRFEGTFDVYCAEFCGTGHSRMWAQLVVLSEEDYARWLEGGEPVALARAKHSAALRGIAASREGASPAGQGLSRAQPSVSMAERGRQVAAERGCFACHTLDGQPHVGPSFLGLYGRRVALSTGERVIADEEYLTRSMMDPLFEVVAGYRPVMPTYLGSLPQPDAAAIVELIKSLQKAGPEPAVRLPDVRGEQSGGPTEQRSDQ